MVGLLEKMKEQDYWHVEQPMKSVLAYGER